MRDDVFKNKNDKQFEFDSSVASVFDDMLKRSVPYYEATVDMMTSMASKYIKPNDTIYDLGCSTGTTLISLQKKLKLQAKLIGIDNSNDMIELAKKKTQAYDMDIRYKVENIFDSDINKSKLVFANYILQFIRPRKREQLVQKIYDNLSDGGVLIFSEKIIYTDRKLDKISIDQYLKYKKSQGYSDFEISNKREKLENVLVPYSEQENKDMMTNAGFGQCQTIFKWLNFATFIAFKDTTPQNL
jgi:tRNA (cmo5U34)-methyltransferase